MTGGYLTACLGALAAMNLAACGRSRHGSSVAPPAGLGARGVFTAAAIVVVIGGTLLAYLGTEFTGATPLWLNHSPPLCALRHLGGAAAAPADFAAPAAAAAVAAGAAGLRRRRSQVIHKF